MKKTNKEISDKTNKFYETIEKLKGLKPVQTDSDIKEYNHIYETLLTFDNLSKEHSRGIYESFSKQMGEYLLSLPLYNLRRFLKRDTFFQDEFTQLFVEYSNTILKKCDFQGNIIDICLALFKGNDQLLEKAIVDLKKTQQKDAKAVPSEMERVQALYFLTVENCFRRYKERASDLITEINRIFIESYTFNEDKKQKRDQLTLVMDTIPKLLGRKEIKINQLLGYSYLYRQKMLELDRITDEVQGYQKRNAELLEERILLNQKITELNNTINDYERQRCEMVDSIRELERKLKKAEDRIDYEIAQYDQKYQTFKHNEYYNLSKKFNLELEGLLTIAEDLSAEDSRSVCHRVERIKKILESLKNS